MTALGLWGNLFAAMLFAAAATVSGDKLVLDGRHARDVVAGLSLSALLASALCALLLRSGLLAGHSSRHGIDAALARPLALALMLGTAGLFAYVAATLARHDRAAANSGGSLLAGAAMVLAAARTSQLTGSAASHTITPADGLQLLGFGLILAAAVRRELHARAVGARAAALAERQRVARDLHDGLAQDLAFIAAHGERIAADIGAEHPVVIAARRALAISRSAIAELSDPAGATAHEALEAIAAELRDRFGISIAVNVELSEELAPDVQEHVSRIAREAIANAARHGGAKHVVVSLDDVEGAVTLRVQDDGSGIQCARDGSAPEGFGLRSMRERASALGGQVTVGQVHERGTLLEVVLP